MRSLLALLLAAALLVPAPARAAAAPSPAAARFEKAEAAFAALKADARAQRQRQSFTRVLDGYRAVFEKHPATRQAELSLLRAGELLTLLYRWTGQEADLNRAQNYYQRLVQSYPKSSLVDDARLAIAYLYLDQLKDPPQAWLKFRDVATLSPGGDKAAEANRQLKRLARFAPAPRPEPTAAPPGTDPACPIPQGDARPAAAATTAAPAAAAGPAGPPPRGAGTASSPGPAAPPAADAAPPAGSLTRVSDIRHWSNPEYSRVVIDLDRQTNFYSNLLEDRSGAGRQPRLYVDLFSSVVDGRLCKQTAVNDGMLLGIRAAQFTRDSVRVVLDIDGLRTYRIFPMQDPFRIVIDVTGGTPSPGVEAQAAVAQAPPAAPGAGAPPSPRGLSVPPAAPIAPVAVPELAPLPPMADAGDRSLPAPSTTVYAGTVPAAPPAAAPAAPPAAVPAPPAPAPPRTPLPAAGAKPLPPPAGKISLARQLGLGVKRIVVDAGHGAHDPGAPGVGGLQEKDVTLDVALRLREVLQSAGYEVVLTRDRDVYLPLEERTALANTSRGDLFISVHCNASDAGNLSGVETYYLNLASSRRSMATAARENSMAIANMSDLQGLLKEIYSSKMDESSRFADAVQRSLHATLRRRHADVKDLGVKQAPFYVLIGAQMPSILAEVSFINHKVEGRRLADPAYRQLVAQALGEGVKRYARSVKSAALVRPPAEPAP